MGAKNTWATVLTLMDASIDPELEREATQLLGNLPGIKKVEKLRARRSGPFYFLDGHVHVASSMDVFHSHALVHEAEKIVRTQRPDVESVILHVEPSQKPVRRVLVPLEKAGDLDGSISVHFGRARCFLVATIAGETIKDVAVDKNTFAQKKVRAGLAVINEFVKKHHLDAVLVSEIGEIAFLGLRNSFVDVLHIPGGTAREAINAYANGRLEYLSNPTHSSEQKLETATDES
jgi:predicted Fe-Mo cluster-binding NifX family protein